MFSEQVTPGSSSCHSLGGTRPMPTPFSRAITQRGLMKSGTQPLKKGDGAGGGGNQTKGTFYFLPRTRRGRERKTPQPFVYLAWRDGCLGTRGCSGGRPWLCCPVLLRCCTGRAWTGSALAPSTASEPAVPGEDTSINAS